jgi:hypothetical protein
MSTSAPISALAALLVALVALHPDSAAGQGRAPERVDTDRPISRGALGLPARGGPRDTVPAGTRGPTDATQPRATGTPPPRPPAAPQAQAPRPAQPRTP